MDPKFTNPNATPNPTPASTSTAVPTILTVCQDRQPNPANAYRTPQVPMDVIQHRVSVLRDIYYASIMTPQRGVPMPAQGDTPLMAPQNTATKSIPAFPLIGAPRTAENVQRDGEVRVPVLPSLSSHPPNDGYTRAYPRQAPTSTVSTPFPAPAPVPQLQCACLCCQGRCSHALCQSNPLVQAAGSNCQCAQCKWYYSNQQHGERNERDD
jgi:hypothetical protein